MTCTTCGIASASCDLVHVEPEHLCVKCAAMMIKEFCERSEFEDLSEALLWTSNEIRRLNNYTPPNPLDTLKK